MSEHVSRWGRWTSEPVLHTFITDSLPDDDPRAWQSIYCTDCKMLVYSSPKETRHAWADTESGPLCLVCLLRELDQL
jgi:hypothetical protein